MATVPNSSSSALNSATGSVFEAYQTTDHDTAASGQLVAFNSAVNNNNSALSGEQQQQQGRRLLLQFLKRPQRNQLEEKKKTTKKKCTSASSHQCPRCPMAFSRKDTLQRHQASVHSDARRPFKCPRKKKKNLNQKGTEPDVGGEFLPGSDFCTHFYSLSLSLSLSLSILFALNLNQLNFSSSDDHCYDYYWFS